MWLNLQWYWLAYLLALALVLSTYLLMKSAQQRSSMKKRQAFDASGLNDPPSLHPVIDPARCVRSGACARACPEKALGVIDGLGTLLDPSACIGHGACAATCPVGAITLVFGTERRGLDIPYVKPNFETNIPGLYIAGELGGMGLIGKSAAQGVQAIASVAKRRRNPEVDLDLVIVGAGPAGLSASLSARHHGLRFVTIEQEASLGGTIYHYPRHKVVMTHPVTLPGVGTVKLGEIRKEALLEFWESVIDVKEMPIRFDESFKGATIEGRDFLVTTSRQCYRSAQVLLSIGRRGSPRKLGVEGEEQAKVVYRLVDVSQYAGQHVLVVGGGDSAIEAALALAEEGGIVTTISYRSSAFSRAKIKNRALVKEAVAKGRICALLPSEITRIDADEVTLDHDGRSRIIRNDAVIICAGGILPMPMLKDMGIIVETKFGTV